MNAFDSISIVNRYDKRVLKYVIAYTISVAWWKEKVHSLLNTYWKINTILSWKLLKFEIIHIQSVTLDLIKNIIYVLLEINNRRNGLHLFDFYVSQFEDRGHIAFVLSVIV